MLPKAINASLLKKEGIITKEKEEDTYQFLDYTQQ